MLQKCMRFWLRKCMRFGCVLCYNYSQIMQHFRMHFGCVFIAFFVAFLLHLWRQLLQKCMRFCLRKCMRFGCILYCNCSQVMQYFRMVFCCVFNAIPLHFCCILKGKLLQKGMRFRLPNSMRFCCVLCCNYIAK